MRRRVGVVGFRGYSGANLVGILKRHRSVCFHAFQGLYLFVAYLIVHSVVGPLFRTLPGPHLRVDKLLYLAILGVSILMIIRTSQEQTISLPILCELAEKSVSES